MPLKNLVEGRVRALATLVCHEIMEDNDTTLDTIIKALDKEIVSGVYTLCQGNKTDTAARLGISRGGLYIKLREYNLASKSELNRLELQDEDEQC